MHPPADLLELIHSTRGIYLTVLEHATGQAATEGSCFYAAVLVRETVTRFSPYKALIRGGDGEGDGGFRARDGAMYGHYWVEATDPKTGQSWVLDVTADQFGEAPARVLPVAEAAAQYVPGSQRVVDEQVEEQGYGAQREAS